MRHSRSPQSQVGAGSPRWLAAVGAVTVTGLAVAGAIGLVPGVALANTARDPHPGPDGAIGSVLAGVAAMPRLIDTVTADVETAVVDNPRAERTPVERPSDDATEPALPSRSGEGRRIVYDISSQRVWLVRADDQVDRTYLVSGALDETKVEPGSYQVYSKSRSAVSFDYEETMQFMVRFTHGERAAIGFHSIPRDLDGRFVQSRDQLGTPLSAGCIRQWRPDAVALWRFSDVGSTVVVLA